MFGGRTGGIDKNLPIGLALMPKYFLSQGEWEKGQVVCDFRGVNPQANWLQFEKQNLREVATDWRNASPD